MKLWCLRMCSSSAGPPVSTTIVRSADRSTNIVSGMLNGSGLRSLKKKSLRGGSRASPSLTASMIHCVVTGASLRVVAADDAKQHPHHCQSPNRLVLDRTRQAPDRTELDRTVTTR